MLEGEESVEKYFNWEGVLHKNYEDGRHWVGEKRTTFCLTYFEDESFAGGGYFPWRAFRSRDMHRRTANGGNQHQRNARIVRFEAECASARAATCKDDIQGVGGS